jgi:quercetin dioxygenase-like cupin family protein
MEGRSVTLIVILAGVTLSVHEVGGKEAENNVVVTPVLSTAVTVSGQPIVLPARDATVIVSTYEIAAGAKLPEHKHPYPRYGYLLTGELRITNTDTGKVQTYRSGAFIVEAIDQWHYAQSVGVAPAKLLVIDQVEHASNNIMLRH